MSGFCFYMLHLMRWCLLIEIASLFGFAGMINVMPCSEKQEYNYDEYCGY